MAVSFVGSGVPSMTTGSSNTTPDYPTDPKQAGDIAILQCHANSSSTTSFACVNWTTLTAFPFAVSGGPHCDAILYRVLTGDETGTFTVTYLGPSGNKTSWVHVFRGVPPLGISGITTKDYVAGANGILDQRVVTNRANSIAINMCGVDSSNSVTPTLSGATGGVWNTTTGCWTLNSSLVLSWATMASPGTIDGGVSGSLSFTFDKIGVTGFFIFEGLSPTGVSEFPDYGGVGAAVPSGF